MATDPPTPEWNQELYNGWVKHLGQHCAVLVLRVRQFDDHGKPVGDQRIKGYSGFVISLGQAWFLVTAGHNLKDVEKEVSAGRIKVTGSAICDDFGLDPKSTIPTPTDYHNDPIWYIDRPKQGLDFALVLLSELQKAGLKRNGIRPLDESTWIPLEDTSSEQYQLWGLPDELTSPSADEQAQFGPALVSKVRPMVLYVDRIESDPDERPEQGTPWFVGKVDRSPFGVQSIVGMSGGPIFGFGRRANGDVKYGVIAVQSWWKGDSSIVYGCPIQVVVGMLLELLKASVIDIAGLDPALQALPE